MRTLIWISMLSIVLVHTTIRSAIAQTETTLVKELEGLQPLIGKTLRGELSNSTAETPVVDVSSWERILNGKGVRMLHSINNGEYGGETVFMWDAQQKKVTYWYFTTAGFTTKGTIEFGDKQWTSQEEVTGNANGITKVRSTSKLGTDGTLHVKSEYYSGDKWSPGHEVTYQSRPDQKVIFK